MKRILAAALLALTVPPALAEERILDFASDIAIAPDASMQVAETIRVNAEGDRIRHGIYRDFPTEYRDRLGNRVHVDFEPESLTRDGADEPWHSERQQNGVRVYFGSKDTLVRSGEHTYVFRYRTTRQLGFFDDHDELYWNVTGNGWDFAIDAASATVALPGSIAPERIAVEGYTGPQGSKGRDYAASADAPSHASFRTTRALAPREGLTIVVSFPKGIVAAPGGAQRARWFLADNGGVLVGSIGLLLVWIYYFVQWRRVGRDPKPGVVIAQYEAPEGFSPGTLRYIERMGYDDRCFAADVVDLAVQGRLVIRQDGSTYTLQRGERAGDLPETERQLWQDTVGTKNPLVLKQAQHATIGAALKAHKKSVKGVGYGRYFHTNSKLVIPGALLCLAAAAIALFSNGGGAETAGAGFMMVWLAGWTGGVIALVTAAVNAWRGSRGIGTLIGALFATLFALPFLIGELVGIGVLVMMTGVGFAVILVALVATNFAFFRWLKAPTPEGRKLLDRIEGLRLYLGVAERDDLARLKAPPMTIDEFQKFLPYALALGVEKTWADRFAEAVGPAAAAAAAASVGWYQGSGGISNLSSFTSGLGSSLGSAISSSSTAPGSSSGGGGGGSSGGGGGGGGGGGW